MCPNFRTFGNLTQLKYLNMKDCKKLTISSETLGNITTLEYLCLPDWNFIEVFPPRVTHQWFVLQLSRDSQNSTIWSVCIYEEMLEMPLDSVGQLRSLEELELHFCDRLKCLSYSISKLTQLKNKQIEMIHYRNMIDHLHTGPASASTQSTIK